MTPERPMLEETEHRKLQEQEPRTRQQLVAKGMGCQMVLPRYFENFLTQALELGG